MWKYCEICYVSITIYMKKIQTEEKKNGSYCSYSATWTNQSGTVVIVQNLGEKKIAHYTKRDTIEALPLFIWLVDVGKFRPWLIELTNFKPKLLIRFIMNKPC